jgi:hypothetical protein
MAASQALPDLMASLIHANLQLTPKWHKHVLFSEYLNDYDTIMAMFSSLQLRFPGELSTVLHSAADISLVKSIPTGREERWGVHGLVMEKEGCAPGLYFGSGCHRKNGYVRRFKNYEGLEQYGNIPTLVKKYLALGFEITHKPLFVTAPLPGPALEPMGHLVFLALEDTLTNIFCALNNKNKWHFRQELLKDPARTGNLASLLSSPPKLLTETLVPWDSLCTHPALTESAIRDFDKTKDELIEHRKEYEAYKSNYQQECAKRRRKEAPEQYRAKDARANAKRNVNVQQKRFWCAICKKGLRSSYDLKKHKTCKAHRLAVKKAEMMGRWQDLGFATQASPVEDDDQADEADVDWEDVIIDE